MERKMIYLDDALDILDDLQRGYENGFNIYADSRKQMLDLSFAQPFTDEEIQKMQDLEFAEIEKAYETGLREGRKKGEWIDYTEDGFVECPFCHSATNCDGNKDELRFCFSCGAELR